MQKTEKASWELLNKQKNIFWKHGLKKFWKLSFFCIVDLVWRLAFSSQTHCVTKDPSTSVSSAGIINATRLLDSEPQGFFATSPALGLRLCVFMPSFYFGALNSGPYTCTHFTDSFLPSTCVHVFVWMYVFTFLRYILRSCCSLLWCV